MSPSNTLQIDADRLWATIDRSAGIGHFRDCRSSWTRGSSRRSSSGIHRSQDVRRNCHEGGALRRTLERLSNRHAPSRQTIFPVRFGAERPRSLAGSFSPPFCIGGAEHPCRARWPSVSRGQGLDGPDIPRRCRCHPSADRAGPRSEDTRTRGSSIDLGGESVTGELCCEASRSDR